MAFEMLFRVNATIESISPSFEVIRGGFFWSAFWTGSFKVFIESIGHKPPFAPEIHSSVNTTGLFQTVKRLSEIMIYQEAVENYHQELTRRLNGSKLISGLIAQLTDDDQLGVYHGSKFPSRTCARKNRISPMRDCLVARTVAVMHPNLTKMTVYIDKPFVASWIEDIEYGLSLGRKLEIGTLYRVLGNDEPSLVANIRHFLDGDAAVASRGYSLRGFKMRPAAERLRRRG